MTWRERISTDPEVLAGKPVIKGTRISVELVLEHFAGGWTEADIVREYSRVTSDDVRACLEYAQHRVAAVRARRKKPVAA